MSHVIISQSLLPSLEACLASIPSRIRACQKKNGQFALTTAPRSGSSSSSQNVFSENPAPADVQEQTDWDHLLG
eukprot:12401180-Karenia_brevis.AAC.1